MVQEYKNPNPVVPEPAPYDAEEGSPTQKRDENQEESKPSKGPEPTLESGERRSMMERPDAQDQKI